MLRHEYVRSFCLATAVVPSFAFSAAASAQCQEWLPGSPRSMPGHHFHAATMFDPDADGPLPARLILGGSFSLRQYPFADDLVQYDGITWSPIFPTSRRGTVNALAVFDFDGSGPNPPRLVVGGAFSFVPNSNYIAVWDGQTLSPLGAGFNGHVNAIHIYDSDGPGPLQPQLYVAGDFSASGTTQIPSHVARWTGAAWTNSGAGIVASSVKVLASIDLDGAGPIGTLLVAGGDFDLTATNSSVAILNHAWLPLGGGLNGPSAEVVSLAVADLDGGGPNPPRLLAAGAFRASGSETALNGQAYYDGAAWRPLAPIGTSESTCISAFDPDGPGGAPAQVLLAGDLSVPGSFGRRNLVWLDRGVWSDVIVGGALGNITNMISLTLPGDTHPSFVAIGDLVGPQPAQQPLNFSIWDGVRLRPFGQGPSAPMWAMTRITINGEPQLLVSGETIGLPGISTNGVAAYDGHAWTSLGTSDRLPPFSLFAFDPDADGPAHELLIAVGDFESIHGVPAHRIAQWDGSAWSAMGDGFPNLPGLQSKPSFASFDRDGDGPMPPRLLATSGISYGVPGNPVPPAHVYEWDGATWASIGDFFSSRGTGAVNAITVFDPDGAGPLPSQVAVVGEFDRVGSTPANHIAVYNGAQWNAMADGIDAPPLFQEWPLLTWDRFNDGREFVVAGCLPSNPGPNPPGVIVWDGTSWSPLGTTFRTASGDAAHPVALELFDTDGAGPAPAQLYATGTFATIGGIPADNIARWNGASWEPVGAGLSPVGASQLVAFPPTLAQPPRLYAAGAFNAADGRPSEFFAQFGAVRCCSADFNIDGTVTSSDLFAFLEAFFSLDPSADVNADGFINSADFFDVLNGLFNGC